MCESRFLVRQGLEAWIKCSPSMKIISYIRGVCVVLCVVLCVWCVCVCVCGVCVCVCVCVCESRFLVRQGLEAWIKCSPSMKIISYIRGVCV